MVGKKIVKCAKCGITSKENFSLTFHRFPLLSIHGSLKARVWAKFCFPSDDWTSDESLIKLHKQHKMLCSNHFDDSSFTSSAKMRLNKFAIPSEAQNIMAQLRDAHTHQVVVGLEEPRLLASRNCDGKPETPAPVVPERPPTPPPTLFCIGCLQKEVPLFNLLTCSHAEFMTSLMVPEIKSSDQVICYQCHEMLKKIKLFKLQVEESFKLLSDSNTAKPPECSNRKQNLTIHETLNLEIPQTSNTDNLETIDDTEKSLAPKRSHKKAKKSRNIKESLKIINVTAPFGSNVIQLTLTKQELIQERARLASSPGYLHTRYRCKSCLIGFQFKENLTDHVKRKHKPRNKQFLLKCRVCRQLVRRDLYDQHTFCHYNRFKCRSCGQEFGSYDNAALHYTIQHT